MAEALRNKTSVDLSSYILYVQRNCSSSRDATAMIENTPASDVCVQSVNDIERPLPPWLNGTPLLVSKKTSRVFRGTSALTELQRIVDQSLQSASTVSKMVNYADPVPVPDMVVHSEEATGSVTDADIERFLQDRDSSIGESKCL